MRWCSTSSTRRCCPPTPTLTRRRRMSSNSRFALLLIRLSGRCWLTSACIPGGGREGESGCRVAQERESCPERLRARARAGRSRDAVLLGRHPLPLRNRRAHGCCDNAFWFHFLFFIVILFIVVSQRGDGKWTCAQRGRLLRPLEQRSARSPSRPLAFAFACACARS